MNWRLPTNKRVPTLKKPARAAGYTRLAIGVAWCDLVLYFLHRQYKAHGSKVIINGLRKRTCCRNIDASPIAAGGAWWLTSGDLTTAMHAGAGCLSGLLISPDLDMETITISEYWLVRWTLGLGWLWVMLWYPYALIAKHRSWLSHAPIIGTLGQVIYLGLFYVGLAALLRTCFDIFLPSPLAILSWPQWLIVVGGLAISDIGHWLLDK